MDKGAEKDEKTDASRRTFLKATVVASAALAVGGVAAIARIGDESAAVETTTLVSSGFPRTLITDATSGQIANINTLAVNQYLTFNYPLDNENNLIMKLGIPAQGGVGPNGDIVAFSGICQHLGCPPGFVYKGGPPPPCNSSYVATGPVMYCCCHGSIYDVANGAKVIGGPAPYPEPQVMLEVDPDSGDIYAVGMGPPTVFGHGTAGSSDVSADLQGGTEVSCTATSSASVSS